MLPGFYDEFDGGSYFSIDIDVNKLRYTNDRNTIFSQVTFGKHQCLYGLIDGACSNRLYFCVLVFANNPRYRPRNSSSTGVGLYLDDIH